MTSSWWGIAVAGVVQGRLPNATIALAGVLLAVAAPRLARHQVRGPAPKSAAGRRAIAIGLECLAFIALASGVEGIFGYGVPLLDGVIGFAGIGGMIALIVAVMADRTWQPRQP